ncbi:hypothetical protein [Rhizobium phage RHph_X2_26]|nr:hypothetical protein [Rhizobium phage RHph_X2_26]
MKLDELKKQRRTAPDFKAAHLAARVAARDWLGSPDGERYLAGSDDKERASRHVRRHVFVEIEDGRWLRVPGGKRAQARGHGLRVNALGCVEHDYAEREAYARFVEARGGSAKEAKIQRVALLGRAKMGLLVSCKEGGVTSPQRRLVMAIAAYDARMSAPSGMLDDAGGEARFGDLRTRIAALELEKTTAIRSKGLRLYPDAKTAKLTKSSKPRLDVFGAIIEPGEVYAVIPARKVRDRESAVVGIAAASFKRLARDGWPGALKWLDVKAAERASKATAKSDAKAGRTLERIKRSGLGDGLAGVGMVLTGQATRLSEYGLSVIMGNSHTRVAGKAQKEHACNVMGPGAIKKGDAYVSFAVKRDESENRLTLVLRLSLIGLVQLLSGTARLNLDALEEQEQEISTAFVKKVALTGAKRRKQKEKAASKRWPNKRRFKSRDAAG